MSLSSQTSFKEKNASIEKIEQGNPQGIPNPEDAHDPAFVRKTIRKVDFRLIPILGGLYAFSLIDRTNISLARAIGMQKDLGLDIGSRYSLIALLFFVPYILLEVPSNVVIRLLGPRWWLGTIATVWGATMLSMGFVKNWKALAGCRVILGALEAGLFPGSIYLITSWYTRREVQKRLAFFYLISVFLTGFTPIFAYGVSTMGVTGGLNPWRWIFIICGIITMSIALLSYVVLVDFPDQAKFLKVEEKQLICDRVQFDRGDLIPDKLTLAKAAVYATDWHIWAFALCYMSVTLPGYAFSFFLPRLLAGMGFDAKDSQLLMCPPYIFSVFGALATSFWADKVGKRGPFIVAQALTTILGVALIAFAKESGARYTGAFLGMFGSQANVPALLAYQGNNIVGQSKRAFTSAMIVGFGGIGGIIASTAYREQDAPQYLPGLWTTLGCQILMIVCVLACSVDFLYKNNQVRRGTAAKPIEGTPGFLYTL